MLRLDYYLFVNCVVLAMCVHVFFFICQHSTFSSVQFVMIYVSLFVGFLIYAEALACTTPQA